VSDVQNTTNEAPVASNSTVKVPGKFKRAMFASGRGIKRASTDLGVWTTATVLTVAEPIVEVGKVAVHTADTKEDQVREFGRKLIERRHARLIKRSESEVEQLKSQLIEARAAVEAAATAVAENPAPESGTSLRPAPATS